MVTRADVARGKPSPDIYLEAASRLRADPADCLALEDSPTGARAAIAAAMPVIIVPDMVTPPPEIARATVGVYASLVTVRDAAAQLWGTREPPGKPTLAPDFSARLSAMPADAGAQFDQAAVVRRLRQLAASPATR